MKKLVLLLALFGCVASSAPLATYQPSEIPIILVFGQSNAVGEAELETLSDPVLARTLAMPFSAVQYSEQIADKPIDPLVWGLVRGPIDLAPRANGGFGLELSMGRRLVELGIKVNIAKLAIGSTSLAHNWQPVDPTYPIAAPHLIDQAITFGHDVEDQWRGRIVGIDWVQSEADASNPAYANAYGENETNLVTRLRAEWPDAWFLFNELHANTYPCEDIIRAQQASVAASVSNTLEIHVDDLPMNPASPAHYTADGYVGLGVRFADATAVLMGGN